MKEWSFAQWVKHKAKKAVQFMNRYEELVSEEAERRGADIVICGHIHNAADQVFGQNEDVRYMNCGCWVEFCSYICEYEDGTMEMIIYDP
jgi:UDP-2,3-diacylglucosamine pyrophosphatase LpxH